jgi:hypothetical protein
MLCHVLILVAIVEDEIDVNGLTRQNQKFSVFSFVEHTELWVKKYFLGLVYF